MSARRLDPKLAVGIPSALRAPGIALAALGAALAAWCIVTFALVGLGTPAPFDAPPAFVAKGPYRFVRNPMYIGAFAVLAGAGLVVPSPAILLVAVGFVLVTHTFVLGYEEPTLAKRFGVTYDAYRKSVGRWLPHRWGSVRRLASSRLG